MDPTPPTAPAITEPLTGGDQVAAAGWPAARVAGRLLQLLGAPTSAAVHGAAAVTRGAVRVFAPASTAEADWAGSGAMWLTGRASGPALHSTGAPATLARGAALVIELLSAGRGRRVAVDGPALLGERAALLGTSRAGSISVGGGGRILRAADAAFALTLSRPADLELLPALVADTAAGPSRSADPWAQISAWAADRPVVAVAERLALLGLPFGVIPAADGGPGEVSPWQLACIGPTSRPPNPRPVVLNLGSLWAAPLAGHLLGLAGFEVIDVESPARPDGARLGTPAFYDLLHAGHRRVEIDIATEAGRGELLKLAQGADVVLTGSRTTALTRLGLIPEQLSGPRVWAHITGHGRHSTRVGFGDDAAVAGGLVAYESTGSLPYFAGDALADPLTGLLAAAAVLACVDGDGGNRVWRIDLALARSAAFAVGLGVTGGTITPRRPHVARRSVRQR